MQKPTLPLAVAALMLAATTSAQAATPSGYQSHPAPPAGKDNELDGRSFPVCPVSSTRGQQVPPVPFFWPVSLSSLSMPAGWSHSPPAYGGQHGLYHTERCMAPEFLNRFLLILRRVQSNLAAALRQGIEGGIVQFTL